MRSIIIYFFWYYDLIDMGEGIYLEKRIVLAGGSGFLGQSLARYLMIRGYMVTILTRGKTAAIDQIEYIHWDGVR